MAFRFVVTLYCFFSKKKKQHVAILSTPGVFLWGKCQLIRGYITDLSPPDHEHHSLKMCPQANALKAKSAHKKSEIQSAVAFDMLNATKVLQGSRFN